MVFSHNAEYCFDEKLKGAGLSRAPVNAELQKLTGTLAALQNGTRPDAKPLLDIAYREDDIAALTAHAQSIRNHSSHVVIAGAGGSSLGGKIMAAFAHLHHTPRLHFLDNIDPDAIDQVLGAIDAGQTHFIVISKSGSTVETLGHFHVLIDHAQKFLNDNEMAQRFTVITMPGDNPMRKTAGAHGMQLLDHPADIGGRFSALSMVGLLPAAIAGLDIAALRKGARGVVDALKNAASPADCPGAPGAAIQYCFMGKGRNISVMLPYSERLSGFSSWYRQSWAESLGKSGRGSTPIRAVGTTDQHSQLQLYLDGPKDKLFHLVTLKRKGTGHTLHLPQDGEFAYLNGRTTGDIMEAQQKATLETFIRGGCPVRHLEIDRLDEETLGALLMYFTLEIIFMAELLQVNPFDQPAVEESKELSRRYMQEGA